MGAGDRERARRQPRGAAAELEANEALRKLQEHIEAVKHQLSTLIEPSLHGLSFEAVRSSMWEDEALWRGVAEEAKRRQAI